MPLEVPEAFLKIPYDPARHPQAAEFDFDRGANCQLFAYALLKHFGVSVPALRSSELWEDEEHTEVVRELEPLDLLLFNDSNKSWGAHVAVYLGDDTVIHLSRRIGRPAICPLQEMVLDPKYKVFIGAKRVRKPSAPLPPMHASAAEHYPSATEGAPMEYAEIRRVLQRHLYCDLDLEFGTIAEAVFNAVKSSALDRLLAELEQLQREPLSRVEQVLNDHEVHLWDTVKPQELLVTLTTLARLMRP